MKPFASSQEVPGHTAGKLADFKPSSTCREQQLHWVSMSCTDNDFTHIVRSWRITTVVFCLCSVRIAVSVCIAVRMHQTPFSVALDLATA